MTAVRGDAEAGARRGTSAIRVGTRASALARAQSGMVAEQLSARLGVEVSLVDIRTHGDVSPVSLSQLSSTLGVVGVFVSALREALVDGRVDIAVHSLKDLPTYAADGVTLAAVPAREDPRDALVSRDGLHLHELPRGARVGTGSPRRAAALTGLGLGLEVVDIRGNVDSRLARVGNDLDAVVVAMAGLRRLGRAAAAVEVLDPLVMLPAPGQGALAVETRSGDPLAALVREALDDAPTRWAVTAERAVLARLAAGCAAPVGALADAGMAESGRPGAVELYLRAGLGHRARGDGPASAPGAWTGVTRASASAVVDEDRAAEQLGALVAAQLAEAAGLDLDGTAAHAPPDSTPHQPAPPHPQPIQGRR